MTVKNQWIIAAPMNLAGIALFEDEFAALPDGDFRCELIDSEDWGDPGAVATSVLFTARILEDGPVKGQLASVWIGKDVTKEGNQRGWKSLYMSLGANESALTNITPHPSHFFAPGQANKAVYVRIRNLTPIIPGQKRDVKETRRQFITEKAYKEAKLKPTPVAPGSFAPASAAPGMPTAATPPPTSFAAPPPVQFGTPQPPAFQPPQNGAPAGAAPAMPDLFSRPPQ